MNAMLNARAMARAGAYTGGILYLLCIGFHLVVYAGSGIWLFQQLIPGVTNTVGGYLLLLIGAITAGAAIPWTFAVLYNRALRVSSISERA